MKLQAGIFLKSTDALNDTLFSRATIFVTEYNANGAVGFVINRPFGRYLNELEEFKKAAHFPLYIGGPVDREHLFFLHQRPDLIDDATLVSNGVYFGGNFAQAVTCLNNKTLTSNHVKILIGYCGWEAGELEAEMEEGSWVLSDEANESIFA
jgi:putative transcriptional regulator